MLHIVLLQQEGHWAEAWASPLFLTLASAHILGILMGEMERKLDVTGGVICDFLISKNMTSYV